MTSHSITSHQLDKAYREDELLIKELLLCQLAKIMNRDLGVESTGCLLLVIQLHTARVQLYEHVQLVAQEAILCDVIQHTGT